MTTIPKEIHNIVLNKDSIKYISTLCFRKNKLPQEIDLLFVFGSSRYDEIERSIIEICKKCKINNVHISGGINKITKEVEAEKILESIYKHLPECANISTEPYSNNTYENVHNFVHISKAKKIYKNIVFISKYYASGRCYYTLKNVFKHIPLISYPYSSKGIKKTNWYKSADSISRTIGEYVRIKEYGEKGDIYTSKISKKNIECIEENIKRL